MPSKCKAKAASPFSIGESNNSRQGRGARPVTGLSPSSGCSTPEPLLLFPGPGDYNSAMHDWKTVQQDLLFQHLPQGLHRMQDVLAKGIVVTTHYSVTGVAEIGIASISGSQGRVIPHAMSTLFASWSCCAQDLRHPLWRRQGPTEEIRRASASPCFDAGVGDSGDGNLTSLEAITP